MDSLSVGFQTARSLELLDGLSLLCALRAFSASSPGVTSVAISLLLHRFFHLSRPTALERVRGIPCFRAVAAGSAV